MPITSATLAASRKSWRDEQYSSSSSSSQFFMKMPTTSQPCCCSSHALTAESTPPLNPTTTRLPLAMARIIPAGPSARASGASCSRRRDAGVGGDQRERMPHTREVVVHAAQQQRAAVPLTAGTDLVGGHPQGADDAGVERAVRVEGTELSAEREAQVGEV